MLVLGASGWRQGAGVREMRAINNKVPFALPLLFPSRAWGRTALLEPRAGGQGWGCSASARRLPDPPPACAPGVRAWAWPGAALTLRAPLCWAVAWLKWAVTPHMLWPWVQQASWGSLLLPHTLPWAEGGGCSSAEAGGQQAPRAPDSRKLPCQALLLASSQGSSSHPAQAWLDALSPKQP